MIGGVGLHIRDWVLRFNARGPDGLVDGKFEAPITAAHGGAGPVPAVASCAGGA